MRETRAAAQPLGVRIQSLVAKDPGQIQSAYAAMTKERAEALIITNNTFNFLPAYAESHGRQPVDECVKRVPSEVLAKEGMLRRVTPKHG